MCRQVDCKQCGNTTWAGCGQHVDQVMKGVPRAQRCEGHQADTSKGFSPKCLAASYFVDAER
ncbi:hypothetical protein L0A91_10650 [Ornithinimicrobium sp. INDO-MA30-4]|nr:hypothetical protein L0A91_10650 [Ornithinimicrobium sp. INDO-MA30-4]